MRKTPTRLHVPRSFVRRRNLYDYVLPVSYVGLYIPLLNTHVATHVVVYFCYERWLSSYFNVWITPNTLARVCDGEFFSKTTCGAGKNFHPPNEKIIN